MHPGSQCSSGWFIKKYLPGAKWSDTRSSKHKRLGMLRAPISRVYYTRRQVSQNTIDGHPNGYAISYTHG